MTKEYLQRYNYTEERFLAWVKAQGMNPVDAINLIITYSKSGQDYRSGDELCVQLIKDLHKIEMDRAVYSVLDNIVAQPKPEEKKKSKLRRIWDTIVGP